MKISESRYSSCLYFSSNALARKMEKLALESWKPVNLSPSHAYLLILIIEQPGMQPGALSEEMYLTPSTVTRLLEKLEERKLIVRANEGRITNVYPSPKGKELQAKLKSCVKNFHEACTTMLSRDETLKALQSMHKLTEQLGE